jgi:hypothetical protein
LDKFEVNASGSNPKPDKPKDVEGYYRYSVWTGPAPNGTQCRNAGKVLSLSDPGVHITK